MCDHEERVRVSLQTEDSKAQVLVKLIQSCFEKQLEDGQPHLCIEVIREIGKMLGLEQADEKELLQNIKPLITGTDAAYAIYNHQFLRLDSNAMRLRILEQISEKLTGMKKQMYDLQAQMTELYEYGERVGMKYESESLPAYKQSWDRMDACVEDVCTWLDCVEKYMDECLKNMTVG